MYMSTVRSMPSAKVSYLSRSRDFQNPSLTSISPTLKITYQKLKGDIKVKHRYEGAVTTQKSAISEIKGR